MHPKHRSIIFIVLLIHSATSASSSSSSSHNGFMSRRGLTLPSLTLEHIDPTLPPVLPSQTPKCSVIALQQDFADTIGAPPASANYTQPADCPAPWTRVVLELSVSASDLQKDRIAAVWIDGVEVLRTSTPLPMAPGAFWKVTKDITRYTAAIRQLSENGIVSMMLENSNIVLPGVYSANVTLHFYRGAIPPAAKPSAATGHATIQGLYKEPADLIIPVSRYNGYYGSGFWFRIENDSQVATSSIKIPQNTYRAVLEIFVSYHADDEFWFGNPLRSSYLQGATNLSAPRNNGGFRQVYATIDGKFVGGHIPFMVLYPGSVNPYFWSPVAAIGAFNMPSYDLDMTPFLGMLLDGQPHELGLGVHDSQQYWLVGANLHIWVDMWSDVTQAGLINYYAPPLKMNRNAEWRNKDGQSEIDAEGLMRFIGWVSSSKGNITTVVQQKIKFKSQVEVQNRGAVKQVEVNNKQRMMVALMKGNQALARIQLMMDAPMQIQTSMVNAVSGAVFQKTRLYHQLQEMVNLSEGQAVSIATLTDRQDAEGSALLNDGVPVWGGGATRSAYRFKDDSTCYLRTVNTAGGIVRLDTTSASCVSVADQ